MCSRIDTNQIDETRNEIRQAIRLDSQVTSHWKSSKHSAASDKSEADTDRWWKQLQPSPWRGSIKSTKTG